MKIFTINCHFKDMLRAFGHDVLEFNISKSGIYDIVSILKKHAFNPDVIIQKEHLGAKVIVSGLHKFDCKKVFWSIDTHINYFWQIYYSRLFDVMFTPHENYLRETFSPLPSQTIIRLPNYAQKRDFVQHQARKFDINMIARMSEHRPCRNNLAGILKNFYAINVIEDVSYETMLSLYTNTRIVPNEAIAFETNFRILEAASCGACVISPQIGADQDEMFHVSREILVYDNASDLLSIIDNCIAHPRHAEIVGYAAWERVQNTHLLKHRVATLLDEIAKIDVAASNSEYYFNATVCMLSLSGQIKLPNAECYFANIECAVLKALLLASQIILQKRSNEVDTILLESLNILRNQRDGEQDFNKSLAVLCGGYALYNGNLELSYSFFVVYQSFLPKNKMRVMGSPRTSDDLYAYWINCLKADGRNVLYGIGYSGYVQTALDFILMHLEKDEIGYSWAREMLDVPAIVKTNPSFCQGAAARIALSDGSLENNMMYIEQSLRVLDIDRAVETIKEVLQQLPTQNSKQAFKNALSKKYGGLERFFQS